MIGWLWRVIVGRFSATEESWCEHEWDVHVTSQITGEGGAPVRGHLFVMRCSICGDMKSHTARV